MNRIVGIETEYGCLVTGEERQGGPEVFPLRVKNHLFKTERVGALDLHYRDYEEPPGNGGFLLNGGRLYLDMGHLEYATPECLTLQDIVAYDRAGDWMLQNAVEQMGLQHSVCFLKNNIDHYTGATFGSHENYLMKREAQFTPQVLAALFSFLATRQIFTGAGRVGQANLLTGEIELNASGGASSPVQFQLSQRADHIVNDIYQWVQFNRALINARDEPLADYRKYRRLHLLLGDSNISEYALALKIGTTALVLDLLEEGIVPKRVALLDSVQTNRDLSRDPTYQWQVRLDNGQVRSAPDLQRSFLSLAQHYCARGEEERWILQEWEATLDALERDPMTLKGKLDWVSKKWLLQMFMEEEKVGWRDPWLQSLDLEYHNLDPRRSLFAGLIEQNLAARIVSNSEAARCASEPPANTRAQGRGWAVQQLMEKNLTYRINWDSILLDDRDTLVMGNPFHPYHAEVRRLFAGLL